MVFRMIKPFIVLTSSRPAKGTAFVFANRTERVPVYYYNSYQALTKCELLARITNDAWDEDAMAVPCPECEWHRAIAYACRVVHRDASLTTNLKRLLHLHTHNRLGTRKKKKVSATQSVGRTPQSQTQAKVACEQIATVKICSSIRRGNMNSNERGKKSNSEEIETPIVHMHKASPTYRKNLVERKANRYC
ncbi:tagaturonate reductase [Anopheles sinensis]|uniref:Tagaturonate reductase n=1 Tax=Anopheles sinensis TaxID=74873 RepID=A0A084VGV7_ANOSI|nr:tagaturonate reductase [Anopheles sinensis]